jgi:hypothetical protein
MRNGAYQKTIYSKNIKTGEIVKHNSFSECAIKIDTNQSAVSRAVKNNKGKGIKNYLLSRDKTFKPKEEEKK